MLHHQDDATTQLLARAGEATQARTAAHGGADPGHAAALVGAYYRQVAPVDLLGHDPTELAAAALSHRQLAERRAPGESLVRVFTPAVDEHGWVSGGTVVEVVTDDMPFLVESVTAELARQGRTVRRVVHPQLQVRRDPAGVLLDVVPPGPLPSAAPTPSALPESWMHVEVDRESDPARLERTVAGLQAVLRDVRHAVEDFPAMRERALLAAEALGRLPDGADGPAGESQQLLRWLADERFTFLGFREYLHTEEDGERLAQAVPGSDLGILRDDGQARRLAAGDADALRPLTVSKVHTRSRVRRPAHLDRVVVSRFDAGRVVGEQHFLGLFAPVTATESVRRIPLLRGKAAALLALTGFSADSHLGKHLLQVLESWPRDQLFEVPVEELEPLALDVLHLQARPRLRLFLRPAHAGRFLSALVYLPRDRYSDEVRQRMEQLLRQVFGTDSADCDTRISEFPLARLHFLVPRPADRALPAVEPEELERGLAAAARSWTDDLAEELVAAVGEQEATRLLRAWPDAFPEAYKEDVPPRDAVADLRRLDALEPGVLTTSLSAAGEQPGERRFKLFREERVSLSRVLPLLQDFGVEVTDERPYQLRRHDGSPAWIYDFGLRLDPAAVAGPEAAALFQEAFAATWHGAAESDGLHALVLRAGLSWRQVTVLRAYARYLRQAGTTFSQDYLESALLAHTGVVQLLVALFEARLDPAGGDVGGARAERSAHLVGRVQQALDEVASLDHDRILRSFLTLICATTRTNHFQHDRHGPKPYLSVKLDAQAVPELPEPRPRFEVWVYSPWTEGVHLRFGHVARGGLRWSDRREDFRTEVLGLVKAQAVKNAVIVPVGAKGGFVVTSPPPTTQGGDARQAWAAAGTECYTLFIRGLLDVTDNLVDGQVQPPPDVVRHDGDDAYLVVAADKGTATFSDLANRVAQDYDFWLGDAFASGGSAGYDHKAMGITARGAWESVRRHFRELGHDTQAEDFTVVGIGDMSGDVFGNGMLLSEHIRLVAAFDHRHVFLDPDPDAAASYAERKRLFGLPRSTWADYDPALLSPGGGVHPRTAKTVPVSPQVRDRLGLAPHVTALAPAELVRAILTAPVDLLWNGGIGTYVKASTQSAADVGDKANDAVRVDGAHLRARVVGEGGNLGLTQLGRVEYARRGADGGGGRINTDAIDNSAGVDTSDHEVNIKILLAGLEREGSLTREQRDTLLAAMTEDVARLVLRHNYEQNVVLGIARRQAASMLPVHQRLLRWLEERGGLDRALESLPGDAALDERRVAGGGLTGPELAVLLAYVKNTLTAQLLGSDLADQPWSVRVLRAYFPPQLVQRYADRLQDHPLRREIVATSVANQMVDRAGTTFVLRAQEETGAAPAEVARAFAVASEVFSLSDYWTAVESLGSDVPVEALTALHLEGRRLLDRSVRWLLQSRRSLLDVDAETARFRPHVAELTRRVPDLVVGGERERLRRRAAEYEGLGAPADLALTAAALLDVFSLLDVVEVAGRSGRPVAEVAGLYFVLSERFEVDRLLTLITALPRADRWAAQARSALRYDLYTALADLTADVLATTTTDPGAAPTELVERWEERNAEGLARARATLTDLDATCTWDLAALSVALRVIRTLVRS